MKNLALLLAISLLLSSCSLMNKDEVETIETPINWEELYIETDQNQNNIEEDDDKNNLEKNDTKEDSLWDDSNTETVNVREVEKEVSNQIETEVTSELINDLESEEALSEVFNEIEELFELAEQNGE
jgi:hypothetical protein